MGVKASAAFLKKRSRKLLPAWTARVTPPMAQVSKSFLVVFFHQSNRLLQPK
jgi:hypothetical protein